MRNLPTPHLSFGFVILALILIGSLFVFLWNPTPLQLLRNNTFDHFQRLKPRIYRETPVRIIDIDDESLKRFGQWPWPRTQIAKLISVLKDAEPSAIALDMIFAEKDRTSPTIMQELWNLSPEQRQLLGRLPDHDQALADSMLNSPTVLGFALSHDHTATLDPILKARFVEIGPSALPYLHSFSGAVTSLPMLERAGKGNGALTFISDADGVIRKVPLVLRYRDGLVPSLTMESLRLTQKAKNYIMRSNDSETDGLSEIQIADIRIPTTEKGEIWLYYSKPVEARYISAWRVLEGRIDPRQLKGKILLIGTSALGLMDLRFSSLGNIIPGIEIHAQALEQILNHTQLIQPGWHTSVEILFLVVAGILLGSIALTTRILLSFMVFVLILAGIWAAAWQTFAKYHLLVDPMVPSVMLLLIFLSSSIFRHFYSERNQRWVKQAFSRYISPNLVDYLISHPLELELGGRRQTCSFVFTDLVDFTCLMESLSPDKAVSALNDYLENMIAIAFKHQGTLDRIVGDAVAIMFSAPIEQADHQRRAIQCALDMHRFATKYSERLNNTGITFGQTRIGIHTGEVIVGNFGGKTIFDYRALGDPVNTASRLESANKYLGTLICVSESTLSACPDIPARPIGQLLLRGKSIPISVYEPLAPETLDSDALREYKAAFELMQDGSADAIDAFQAIVKKQPNDGLVAFQLRRLLNGTGGDLIKLDQK